MKVIAASLCLAALPIDASAQASERVLLECVEKSIFLDPTFTDLICSQTTLRICHLLQPPASEICLTEFASTMRNQATSIRDDLPQVIPEDVLDTEIYSKLKASLDKAFYKEDCAEGVSDALCKWALSQDLWATSRMLARAVNLPIPQGEME